MRLKTLSRICNGVFPLSHTHKHTLSYTYQVSEAYKRSTIEDGTQMTHATFSFGQNNITGMCSSCMHDCTFQHCECVCVSMLYCICIWGNVKIIKLEQTCMYLYVNPKGMLGSCHQFYESRSEKSFLYYNLFLIKAMPYFLRLINI